MKMSTLIFSRSHGYYFKLINGVMSLLEVNCRPGLFIRRLLIINQAFIVNNYHMVKQA